MAHEERERPKKKREKPREKKQRETFFFFFIHPDGISGVSGGLSSCMRELLYQTVP